MLIPTSRVSITFLRISPGIVSLIIFSNMRLSIVEWDVSLSLLGKGSCSSWCKSSTIVGNPIDMIGSGGVGLSTPCNLVGLVVLSIVPCMVSLGVWRDVGCAIPYWVDFSLSLNQRCNFSIISFDLLTCSFS